MWAKRMRMAALMTLVSLTIPAVAQAQEAKASDGLAILEQNCLRCHGVGVSGRSPHSDAPTFAEVANRYEPEFLAEALAEGIVTGHPDMPEFIFTPREIDAILAFLYAIR